MKRIASSFLLLVLLFALSSHELFLKSESYFLDSNSSAELFLLNGTFDKSENVITRDRIIDPQVIGPGFTFTPDTEDYYDRGEVTYMKIKTGEAGTYVAGVSTLPRGIEMDGKKFTEYLEHEGLEGIIADRKNKGISTRPAKEKYSKHVKALLQVGEERTSDHATELGYPIEFIPLKNPYALSVGDEMSFKLLLGRKPLGHQTVHVSSRKSIKVKEGEETSLKTNKKGEVSFPISNPGQWYIATIFMTETDEADYDYESNWATLTFEVKAPMPNNLLQESANFAWLNKPEEFAFADGKLEVVAGRETDFFNNPEDLKKTATAPVLFKEIEGDFVATALIKPDFSSLWNAISLMVHIDHDTWIKFAFENSDATGKSIVTVVTKGVSDDANGAILNDEDQVWLKLVRKNDIYSMLWSLDGVSFKMARLTTLPNADAVKVGLEFQSPVGEPARHEAVYFGIENKTVADLRKGE